MLNRLALVVITAIWMIPIIFGVVGGAYDGVSVSTDGYRHVLQAGIIRSVGYTLPYAMTAGCVGVTIALGCIRLCGYGQKNARRLLAFAAGARAFPAAVIVILWLSVLRTIDFSDSRWLVAMAEGILLSPLGLIVLVPRHMKINDNLRLMATADGLTEGVFFREVEVRSLQGHIFVAMMLLSMTAWGSEVFVVRALSGPDELPLARFLGQYVHPYNIEWTEIRAASACAVAAALMLVTVCHLIVRTQKEKGSL